MIDSDRLEAFLVFAEELNFTRAARRLHISQPALHVQVKQLAEALGFPLYQRTGRGLTLTVQGQELQAFGRELRDRTDVFFATLGKPTPSRRLVIAAGEGTLLYKLGAPIGRLSRDSSVQVRALTRDREGILASVMSGEAHLGVAPLDAVPDRIHATPLSTSRIVAVFDRRHRLAKKRAVRLVDLAGERLVLPPADRPHRVQLARALQAEQVDYDVSLEATGWELMLHFAALGIGIALVNDICRLPKGCVSRPVRGVPPITYYLLQRADAVLPQPAARLRELIIAAFV